ncbi:MAG: phytanoyl-CoA dioxygenase family protein [Pseudomonadota bacterium]|jgi:ectoine hydroxylase-related dioxygenase (phytanoyl-CoA dioxygenase family)|uniref:Phytanoyl-CoA dioxygenase n=1 Tax=hydrothermal vent metagenome TaxID=652676 RepID=A0A160TIA7_9ZZZZ
MYYPEPTEDDIAQFEKDGFLVVREAIDPVEQQALADMGAEMIERPADWGNDWDWRRDEPLGQRSFRIVQSGVDRLFPWLPRSRFRSWATRFGGALMGQDMAFWYEQFLAKPPGVGAPTPWHQDEAYWGRTLQNRGVTCWTAFHAVGIENGCMHFVRGGHGNLLEHRNPPEMASDLLVCEIPGDSDVVVCPIEPGSVTFHHSATPHMTTGNSTGRWRQSLTQHFRNPGCAAQEPDHYSWRVRVSQRADE